MEKLPQEIIIEILEYLPFQELLKLELINKQFKKIIRENEWKKLMVSFNENMIDTKLLEKFITNHNFINYDFKGCEIIIIDKILKFLKNCHTLNLSCCKQITDQGLSHLTNCHTLNLSCCNQITDRGLSYLTNYHILKLFGCLQISQNLINELIQKGINVIR